MIINRNVKNAIEGYLFILPNLIGFAVFTMFSVVFSLIISFTDWNMVTGFENIKFIGFQNYIDIFSDKWFINSIANNIYFILFIPFQIILALVIAVIVNDRIYFAKFVRTAIYLPYVTNVVIISLLWSMLLNPSKGIVNNILISIGIMNPPAWLGSTVWVKPSIITMMTWAQTGYTMILFLSGLQGIPVRLYEAARIDGASRIKQFFHITIPMISPTTFFVMITSIISNFQMWSNIQILTAGGPGTASTVIGYYIYKSAFEYGKMGYASSMAWVLFAGVFVITLIQWRGQKKMVNYL